MSLMGSIEKMKEAKEVLKEFESSPEINIFELGLDVDFKI